MHEGNRNILFLALAGGAGALAYFYYSQNAAAAAAVPASNVDTADQNTANAQGFINLIGYTDDNGNPLNFPNTRGFRNNNPGNLRYIASNPFNGQVGNDGGNYGVYDTLQNGVRALGKQLDNYVNAGHTTITGIISKWAPPSENNTLAYIADVSARMNISPDNTIAWPGEKPELVDAIIQHENGSNPINFNDLISFLNS